MGAQCCSNEGNQVEKINPVQADEFSHKTHSGAKGKGFTADSVVLVTIMAAQGLDHPAWKASEGPKEPYCVVEIPGKPGSRFKTKASSESVRDPSWNFQTVLPTYVKPDTLLFTVFDKDNSNYQEHLGKAQLTANRIEAGNGLFEGTLPLAGVDGITSVPTLNVKVEAVARPKDDTIGKPKTKDPTELPKGRLVRIGITKQKDQQLGLLLMATVDGKVSVAEVNHLGAVADYNRGAKVHEQLQVGDLILEANGMTSEKAILKELASPNDVELLVECKADIFKVLVNKPEGMLLGIDLYYKESREPLVIVNILDGAVLEYNKSVSEDKKVKIDDHIMSVNGVKDAEGRMQELQKATGNMELMIRRVFGLPKDAKKAGEN